MTAQSGRWIVERRAGPAAELHAAPMPDPVVPAVWVLDATAPALVLGSAQREDHVDAAALERAGVDLVRRRSGGGAVFVVPGGSLWIDLLIPRGDPLWDDDVGRAMHWVGAAWSAALHDLGVDGRVHQGSMVRSEWSGHVCFAGLGPGEVTDAEHRKIVGISQRRTRAGARFQTVVHLGATRVDDVVDLLALGAEERAALREALRASTATLHLERSAAVEALLAHLPG